MVCKLQLQVITVLVLLSDAVHQDNVIQETTDTLIAKSNVSSKNSKPIAALHQKEGQIIPDTHHMSNNSMSSLKKLQGEIKELNRMQTQMNFDMAKGTDTAKKEKFLQHIQRQIHLRQDQLSQQQNHSIPEEIIQPSQESQTQVVQGSRKSTQELQNIQQKVNVADPFHPRNVTKDIQLTADQQTKETLHQQRQKQGHHQQQQLQPQYSQDKLVQIQQQANSHGGNNWYMNDHHSLKHAPVENKKSAWVKPNQQTQYLNHQIISQAKYNLPHWQEKPQVQQMLPQYLKQHGHVQTSANIRNPISEHQGQLPLLGQQTLKINQALFQPGTQQILVPIDSLSLKGVLPSPVLPNKRLVVVRAISDKNGQINTIQIPKTMDTAQPKHDMSVTPLPSPTTTISTTTTPATTTTRSTMPMPPTTYSYLDQASPVSSDTIKQEFYKGEIKKQELEIKKLHLEIRALQRNEMKNFQNMWGGGGGGGGGENEDAPAQNRFRFGARAMPFSFF